MTRVDLTKAQCAELANYLRGIACLGCGYEHNCSVHGCRILRDSADRLERLAGDLGSQKVMECRDRLVKLEVE